MLLLSIALAAPTFSVERGLQDAAFELNIDGDDVQVALGSNGTFAPYTGPLSIEGNTVVRAYEGGSPDDVALHSYLFVDEVLPTLDPTIVANDEDILRRTLTELPTITLTVFGNLTQTETMTSVEWLDPDGERLQVYAGIRRVGGHSLNYEKNNLRLNFRNVYGAGRWDADLYEGFESGLEPATRHDSLVLRGGSHDSVFYLGERGQYLRNRWMDETQLAMGHVMPHGRYAHVYLDLDYIGLYQVRERFSSGFLSEMLGGEEDDYEAVNSGRIVDGTGTGWARVIETRGDYEAQREVVDVENLVDYMLLNFYAGNDWDWTPEHNWMAAGSVGDGGWTFHSSDSDICLWYAPDINILDQPGPSWLFSELVAEGHPDFMVLLADRIHVLLEGDGPLTPRAAADRYMALSTQIEDAVVAESARWGAGWWTDAYWYTERTYLLETWFMARTDILVGQLRDRGWARLGAPVFSREGGPVAPGDTVTVSLPEGQFSGGVVLTLDGTDPRLPGGELAPNAVGPADELLVMLDGSRRITARVLDGDSWGPLHTERFEDTGPSSVVLNEWNAVAPDEVLAEGDPTLGQEPGNGGDWLELLVIEDVDLSGWRLLQFDDGEPAGELVFADHERLVVPAGTLLTIATDLPEDVALDPGSGDWRMHLKVGGELVDGTLDVHNSGWSLELVDATGRIRQDAVGEGIQFDGLGRDEVGQLAAKPLAEPIYQPADGSTFGLPNTWEGGEQDLSTLRRTPANPPVEVSVACGHGFAPVGWFALALVLVGCRRDGPCYTDADGDGWGGDEVDCESPSVTTGGDCDDAFADVNPGAFEVCGGGDEDCDGLVDADDDDVADAIPLFEDLDGDGFGGDVVGACVLDEGLTLVGGDCDDADATIHPGAPEACDDIDADCDGIFGGQPGDGEECPAASCLDALNQGTTDDGPVWLALPNGGTAPVWCDMARGGWTLAFVRNSASTGDQPDFGASDVGVANLAFDPAVTSTAGARMGWLDLNAFPYDALRLVGYRDGIEHSSMEAVQRSELRIAFGEPGYLLYGPDIYWCGGPASYTDAGEGAVDNPEGAPLDCKGHGSLGSGWDYSASPYGNAGLTLCGGDGSAVMTTAPGSGWVYFGTPGGAQAIWVR